MLNSLYPLQALDLASSMFESIKMADISLVPVSFRAQATTLQLSYSAPHIRFNEISVTARKHAHPLFRPHDLSPSLNLPPQHAEEGKQVFIGSSSQLSTALHMLSGWTHHTIRDLIECVNDQGRVIFLGSPLLGGGDRRAAFKYYAGLRQERIVDLIAQTRETEQRNSRKDIDMRTLALDLIRSAEIGRLAVISPSAHDMLVHHLPELFAKAAPPAAQEELAESFMPHLHAMPFRTPKARAYQEAHAINLAKRLFLAGALLLNIAHKEDQTLALAFLASASDQLEALGEIDASCLAFELSASIFTSAAMCTQEGAAAEVAKKWLLAIKHAPDDDPVNGIRILKGLQYALSADDWQLAEQFYRIASEQNLRHKDLRNAGLELIRAIQAQLFSWISGFRPSGPLRKEELEGLSSELQRALSLVGGSTEEDQRIHLAIKKILHMLQT